MFNVYSEKIFYFENIIKNPSEIIRVLESTNNYSPENSLITPWHEWVSDGSEDIFGYRKLSDKKYYKSATDEVKFVYDTVSDALNEACLVYCRELSIPEGFRADLSISKYSPEAYMGPHADDGENSHISAVAYLNDDFEGGGLEFPNQNIFIKPTAGSIIIFPSVQPFVHDPKPASGVKYISPAFWYLENTPLRQG